MLLSSSGADHIKFKILCDSEHQFGQKSKSTINHFSQWQYNKKLYSSCIDSINCLNVLMYTSCARHDYHCLTTLVVASTPHKPTYAA